MYAISNSIVNNRISQVRPHINLKITPQSYILLHTGFHDISNPQGLLSTDNTCITQFTIEDCLMARY